MAVRRNSNDSESHKMPDSKEKIESLISTGSKIAGAVTGEAVAFLVGGPGGAAIGGVLTKILSDIADRILSKREKMRVGATAAFALEKIKSYLDAGLRLRDDGFFQGKEGNRADAEEIFEGVLLKAKNEHEEKKSQNPREHFRKHSLLSRHLCW